MIHSARPIGTPVANIVFFCFVFLDLKSGEVRTTCAKTMIPNGRDFGLAEWINCYFYSLSLTLFVIHRPKIACSFRENFQPW